MPGITYRREASRQATQASLARFRLYVEATSPWICDGPFEGLDDWIRWALTRGCSEHRSLDRHVGKAMRATPAARPLSRKTSDPEPR
jgi:hypothetical protein